MHLEARQVRHHGHFLAGRNLTADFVGEEGQHSVVRRRYAALVERAPLKRHILAEAAQIELLSLFGSSHAQLFVGETLAELTELEAACGKRRLGLTHAVARPGAEAVEASLVFHLDLQTVKLHLLDLNLHGEFA